MTKCMVDGCRREGTLEVILYLRPKRVFSDRPQADELEPARVCEEHAPLFGAAHTPDRK